jgi:hypothetical protein
MDLFEVKKRYIDNSKESASSKPNNDRKRKEEIDRKRKEEIDNQAPIKKRRPWFETQEDQLTDGENQEITILEQDSFLLKSHDSDNTESVEKSENKSTSDVQKNSQQEENKQSTIGLQEENKQSTIGLQEENKQSTIGLQLDHKRSTIGLQLDYNWSTKQSTNESTIGLQLDYKRSTKQALIWHFSSLTGHERNFVLFIFQNCKNVGSLTSSPFSNSQLRDSLKIRSSSTLKTVIDRVIKKDLILKKPGKTGRGGWMVFEIKKNVFQDLLLGESDYNWSTIGLQTDYKRSTKQSTEQSTNTPSKLDSKKLINNYLANEEPNTVSEKDTNWFKILDFSPVSPIGAMQVNSSIRTLVQEKLQPEQVQEFLNRFKNWLATQQKIQNPLAIFCDRLKEFATEGDSAILSVMTDQEREIEAQFIEETKKAKAQIQLIEKAQIEKSKNQEENLRTEAEAEFEEWYNSASDIELAQMAPPIDIAPLRSGLHKISTKSAFMSKILFAKQK